MRRIVGTLIALVAGACTPTADQQAVTTGPDVDAIAAWLEQTLAAYNSGDIEGSVALYTDDALSMPPTEPVSDMDATRAMMEAFLGANDVQITAGVEEIVVSGDLGLLRVTYDETWTPKAEGEPGQQHGTWLVILRKQADGSWKLWRDMWTNVPTDSAQ